MSGARKTPRPDLRAQWRTWIGRFEQRTVRERAMLIGAACAVVFMLADALWLSPALKQWNSARAANAAVRAQIGQLHTEQTRIQASGMAQEARLKQELASWRARVREGDAALREQATSLVGPERMLSVLDQLLARHGQVRVRAMQSLGKTDLSGETTPPSGTTAALPAKAAAAAASAPAPAARGPGLYRHGVELTLEGSYADLAAYVRALEAMPQRLLWGGLQFRVEQYPKAVLTLRLYTLSLERHWLEI